MSNCQIVATFFEVAARGYLHLSVDRFNRNERSLYEFASTYQNSTTTTVATCSQVSYMYAYDICLFYMTTCITTATLLLAVLSQLTVVLDTE